MPTQTYSITAPNGKSLDVTGDHVPTESELKDIFKAAGVSTESSAGSSSDQASAFVPSTAKEFATRMGNAAIDVPIGAVKNIGRAVQMIPGVATGTDKLFGLPSGASIKAMQASNPTQAAGGYVGDAALMAATAGAEAGPAIMTRTAGYVSNPTVLERLGASKATAFADDTVTSIASKLKGGGPITPDKVADLIVKYGKDAVKLALVGIGGAAGYEAWRAARHLF